MNSIIKSSLLTLGVGGALLVSAPAAACGGFFCNAGSPVNQAAERIIFAKNKNGTITQVVEVEYEGPSENFAWILPVPGTPDVNVSSTIVLDALQNATNPNYQLNNQFTGECFLATGTAESAIALSEDSAADSASRVAVVDSGSVGPYNYQTISVSDNTEDPAQVALEWLEENDYDIGSTTSEVLSPYLEAGLNLIAFRLQSDKSAGAIRPISLNYESERASIPIVPTSVAANDDMGIMVWVLGESRAVPTNYFGLELNEAQIDWFNPGPSYNSVVTAAANEAGGHGFVTEMADETSLIQTQLNSLEVTSEDLGRIPGNIEFALQELASRFNGYDGLADVMSTHVSLRDGVSMEEFLSCTYCYFNPGETFFGDFESDDSPQAEEISAEDPVYDTDLDDLIAAIEEEVAKPVNATIGLFSAHPYFTRLYTTMSADEMDEDPIFEFNPDLETVSNLHIAEQETDCETNAWTITLESGAKIYGDNFDWPLVGAAAQTRFNSRIVSFGTQGAPEVVEDFSAEISDELSASGVADPVPNDGEKRLTDNDNETNDGCSYLAGPSQSHWLISLLSLLSLAALTRTRRRSH